MTCIAISRDGNTLASGQITHMGYLAEIILWDISGLADGSGKAPVLLNRLRLHKVMVQALDFSYNGKYLASIGGSDDNNLVIWNVANGKAICGSPAAHERVVVAQSTSGLPMVVPILPRCGAVARPVRYTATLTPGIIYERGPRFAPVVSSA